MKLAINGGKPLREKKFPAYNVIGQKEKDAVRRVMDSGILSHYLGAWHEGFYGGSEVKALEEEWADYFGAKHAIAVNSCTSGLYCATGAAGIEPGDEVIVSPTTMSASATAALVFGGIPVFADIEEEYFCLDPDSIEERITSRTKAIVVVDIFGQPYNADRINAIAKKHGLIVIEDAAQAPGAMYRDKYAGNLADIGVFSLNYHKHIHCGEGGVIITNDDELADRMRLIRNHAEAVVEGMGKENIVNMIGFNFRMPEIEAAITRCQLEKLESLISENRANAEYLAERLGKLPGIHTAKVREGATHAYYGYPFKYFESELNVHRNDYIDAVRAELPLTELREREGALLSYGYVKPLYLQPMYQKKIAFGSEGWPFTVAENPPNYEKGLCPVAERMHEQELCEHEFMRPGMTEEDMEDVIEAFEKVHENIGELKQVERIG